MGSASTGPSKNRAGRSRTTPPVARTKTRRARIAYPGACAKKDKKSKNVPSARPVGPSVGPSGIAERDAQTNRFRRG